MPGRLDDLLSYDAITSYGTGAGISELPRAQNLASFEHQPRPVRERLRAIGQEEPRHSK